MANKGKIFIIDDDPHMVDLYSIAFKESDYTVETDFDGTKGLKKLTEMKEKPTIILSDVMMPGMHGLDLLSKIKENPELKKIPVVLMTNLDDEADIKKGLELGAVTYLIKNRYTPKEIVNKIKELLSGYERDATPEVMTTIKN